MNPPMLRQFEIPIEFYEQNDCTVRTLSQAFEITYEASHKLCAAYGRKEGHGFYITAKLMEHLKDKLELESKWIGHKVWTFLACSDPKATYVVLVKGHIFCVKDSKRQDYDNSSIAMIGNRERIIRVWRMK